MMIWQWKTPNAWRPVRRLFSLAAVLAVALSRAGQITAAESVGHQPEVKVSAATRIDWVFALSNQSPAEPPEDWLPKYDSLAQTYELYVPEKAAKEKPSGLVLFISPGDRGSGFAAFRKACDELNLIFASPHKAGNGVDTKQRMRIVLDVLDDVRRRFKVDPDRTYIGGFSGGGRIACAVAFSLPEYFGGVLPVCAAGDLREEPWLRHRVMDRLSVAHLSGETDFNRGEVERFRGPMLAAVGVRSKVWVVPKVGHAIPSPTIVEKAVRWLDEGLETRRKLAKDRPASRAPADGAFPREAWAGQLLAEGKSRLENKATTYAGLMQLKGVLDRWPDLAAAKEAKTILLRYEEGPDKGWQADDIAEQRKFLLARARSLSDYAASPLPAQYKAQLPGMAKAAISLWGLVIDDGHDEKTVAEGRKRVAELEKLLLGEK